MLRGKLAGLRRPTRPGILFAEQLVILAPWEGFALKLDVRRDVRRISPRSSS